MVEKKNFGDWAQYTANSIPQLQCRQGFQKYRKKVVLISSNDYMLA